MNQQEKDHAEDGCHYLSGTSKSPIGVYYGFIPTGETTVISNITMLDSNTDSGDIKALTMIQGLYYPVTSGFTDITLTSGDMILFKNNG